MIKIKFNTLDTVPLRTLEKRFCDNHKNSCHGCPMNTGKFFGPHTTCLLILRACAKNEKLPWENFNGKEVSKQNAIKYYKQYKDMEVDV